MTTEVENVEKTETEAKKKTKKKSEKKTKKADTFERNWYLLNADGKNLGRLSTRIVSILTGKNKPIYARDVDKGDFVVVVNAKKIRVSGRKVEEKNYYRHSGYPGGLKVTPYKELAEKRPEKVLEMSVNGMLPKNKLRKPRMKRLKVYSGDNHPHKAQKLVEVA